MGKSVTNFDCYNKPMSKKVRNFSWIIPVVIIVLSILGTVVFYFDLFPVENLALANNTQQENQNTGEIITTRPPEELITSTSRPDIIEVIPTEESSPEQPAEQEPEPLFNFDDIRSLINYSDLDLPELHMISSFTTYHDCCAARVDNIQRLAQIIDGAVVQPGEIFSVNDHVGERTEEKGFVPAGTIMGGELVNTVGGGVSQFATTLYNAVYWAGLQDIEHHPHSWSFSRYPNGIEATISWPELDLRFRNNTEKPVIIHTSFTDYSITAEIWGDNDGRIMTGDHKNSQTSTNIIEKGGENARIVTSYTTPTYREINTIPTLIYPNTAIRPGFEIEMNSGIPGKVMNVFRTIEHQGVETIDTWKVVYRPIPREIHVHPCELSPEQRTHKYEKYDYSWVSCPIE